MIGFAYVTREVREYNSESLPPRSGGMFIVIVPKDIQRSVRSGMFLSPINGLMK